eukprot:jgi/Botrbrau1/18533/Bobra.0818s0002.1
MCNVIEEDLNNFKPKGSSTIDLDWLFDSRGLAARLSEGFDLSSHLEECLFPPCLSRKCSTDICLWDALPSDGSTGGENDPWQQVEKKSSRPDAASQNKSIEHNVMWQVPLCLQEDTASRVQAVQVSHTKRKLDLCDPGEESTRKSPRRTDVPFPPRSVFAREKAPRVQRGSDFTQDNLLEHLPHIPSRHQVNFNTEIWIAAPVIWRVEGKEHVVLIITLNEGPLRLDYDAFFPGKTVTTGFVRHLTSGTAKGCAVGAGLQSDTAIEGVFMILRTQSGEVVEIRNLKGRFRTGAAIPGVAPWCSTLTAELVVKVTWRGLSTFWLRAQARCLKEESSSFSTLQAPLRDPESCFMQAFADVPSHELESCFLQAFAEVPSGGPESCFKERCNGMDPFSAPLEEVHQQAAERSQCQPGSLQFYNLVGAAHCA